MTLAPEAKHGLQEVYRYIAMGLQPEQSANSQLDRLEENTPKLDEMPGRFQAYGREPWRTRNPRGMPMDNCLVSYNPGSPGKTVTVPRVLCGGREIEAQPAIFRGEIVAVSFIPFPSGTQEVWWFGFH